MPIPVTCTKCHARFQVSEKFAGKKGKCPKCTGVITIPKLDQQVQVDDRAHGGTKDATGKLVLKPLERVETKVRPVVIAGIAIGVIAAIVIAWVLGSMYTDKATIPWFILAAGALAIGVPLSVATYGFLRNDELEPHSGASLWLRGLVFSIGGLALWLVYYYFVPPEYRRLQADPLFAIMAVFPFIVAGCALSLVAFDFDLANAAMHFAMYMIACIVLCVVMGWPMIEPGEAPPKNQTTPETIRVPQFGR